MNSLELKDAISQKTMRCKEIVDLCKKEIRTMTPEEQEEFDAGKAEIEELKKKLAELQEKLKQYEEDVPEDIQSEETDDEENNNHVRKMKKERFSLVKAIRKVANNQPFSDLELAVIKAGQDEARKSGQPAQGQIQLPTEELRASVTVTAEGEDVVATDIMDILTPLREKSVLAQAGAKFYTNLTGDVQVPVLSGNNVSWESEVAAAKDAAPVFTNVKLQPKRLTAFVDISKQLIAQDSIGVENAIKQDIINAVNAKIESTILSDSADATAPEGIFEAIEPTAVASYADIVAAEADVEAANVYNECKYILSPLAKAALRAMPINGAGSMTVYQNAEVDGTKALSTGACLAGKAVYGDFSNYAVGFWSGIDITVDQFSRATNGEVRLVVNVYVDGKVLRPEAFKTMTLAEVDAPTTTTANPANND